MPLVTSSCREYSTIRDSPVARLSVAFHFVSRPATPRARHATRETLQLARFSRDEYRVSGGKLEVAIASESSNSKAGVTKLRGDLRRSVEPLSMDLFRFSVDLSDFSKRHYSACQN